MANGDHGRVLSARVGRGLAGVFVSKGAEERGREGGTVLGLHGVDTSSSTVATMAVWACGACPLAATTAAVPCRFLRLQ